MSMAISINKSELDQMYELFQFEKLEEAEDSTVFAYSSGYFNNIEIFATDASSKSVQSFKKKYTQVGYPVRVVSHESLQDLHENLFRGFFKIDRYIQSNKIAYNEHCLSETKRLAIIDSNAQYEYVRGNFYKNGNALNSENIISILGQEMQDSHTKLIILEAAAGMGKTSTSYEVLNYLLTHRDSNDLAIPVLIELTKNRNARIFRHVLDDEIDRNFSGLKRDLVLYEIKRGNILLIIDGFDELLTKPSKGAEEEVNDGTAQSMLETIAELFEEGANTKVILTSRKSSIFIGEQFDNWADTKLTNIPISRYQLAKPTIQQWLGEEKFKILREKKVPIQSLENPVLLSFYKYNPIEEILSIGEDYSLVDKYFEKMLEREVSRQQLKLSVAEQRNAFMQLARLFVLYEINSETSDFIKSLFLTDILADKVSEYMARYFDSMEKPVDEDEFTMKFVRHALLDRISPFSNSIGFVNDLVFGTLIAESIIKETSLFGDLTSVNAKYILIASNAYAFEHEEKRTQLYSKIKMVEHHFNAKQKLSIELDLLKNVSRDFSEEYIDSMVFSDVNLDGGVFQFCSFVSCVFENCSLDLSKIFDCTFINCKFYNITILNENNVHNLYFSNCVGHESFPKEESQTCDDEGVDYKKVVLENFWKPGKLRAESQRSENAIYRGTQPSERSCVAKAIQRLEDERILSYAGGFYYLSHEKMADIRKILGRE